MKIIYKSLLATALALVGFTFNSCDDGDAVVDEVFENTTSGIVLRTSSLISNELPIGESDATFSVELEMQDEEDGALVDNLDVYISFRDNTVEEGETDYDVLEEVMAATIPSSEFTIGEYGFPRVTYTLTLQEMLNLLSVDENILDGGDQFYVRFVANLTDGRSFSNTENTDTSTGSFFASPFLYTPTIICPVDSESFVGEYSLTVTPTSPVGGVPVWEDQTVTISVGETSTQRVFEAIYIEGLGLGNGPESFTFDMICGEIIPLSDQSTGLRCVDAITLGPVEDEPYATYDVSDDSTITVIFAEDELNDCGAGTTTMTATLTKL